VDKRQTALARKHTCTRRAAEWAGGSSKHWQPRVAVIVLDDEARVLGGGQSCIEHHVEVRKRRLKRCKMKINKGHDDVSRLF
jgi:hypothetical protein